MRSMQRLLLAAGALLWAEVGMAADAGGAASKAATDTAAAAQRLEADLEAQIAAHPEDAAAYQRLAAFYLGRHRAREAIAAYQEAIQRDPENPRLFVGIAIAYLHRQAHAQAKAMIDRALELDPGLANARKLDAYLAAKRKTLAEAHRGLSR